MVLLKCCGKKYWVEKGTQIICKVCGKRLLVTKYTKLD